ncbi:MAG: hypothetical protein ACFHX7_22105 [Pseudomonadota bacterium]
MKNVKAPCPKCNSLIWVGVPEGRELNQITNNNGVAEIKMKEGKELHGAADCPKCETTFYVILD